MALYVRHFGDALALRDGGVRIMPEASKIAYMALQNCGIEPDFVVDDTSPSYVPESEPDPRCPE